MIGIILGTRPEIIKFAPIIHECHRRALDWFLLHTGQHYSVNMDQVFFDQLGLEQPTYHLNIGSGTHAEQTGKMLIGIEQVLQDNPPDVILVEGDTNTVLAGALAAVKLGIPIGHVEAGLRSYDRRMPEEINRVLADHCADLLFAPTKQAAQTLHAEGIPSQNIYHTGNTIVDAIYQNIEQAKQSRVLEQNHVHPNQYLLTTIHRQENVDNPARFTAILTGLQHVQQYLKLPVIYPIHPRAKKQLSTLNISPENLSIIDPVDYLSFLALEQNARLILTDSGGVQEEACILGVPCITLRDNTERPETVAIGANRIAGTHPADILTSVQVMLTASEWTHPFGDGTAAQTIVQILQETNTI